MSSAASSPLKLELKPAWGLLAALFVWLFILSIGVWRSALPLSLRLTFSFGVLVAGLFILSRQLPGLVSASLCQATVRPDGAWLLLNGRGEQWEATLLTPSRFIRNAALLRWTSQAGSHWTLVTARSAGPTPFRRLRVRLRFS